jgi:hypothetical protein
MRTKNIRIGVLLSAVLAAVAALAIAGTYERTEATTVDFRGELRNLYAHLLQERKVDVAGVIRVYDGGDGKTLKEENTFRFIRQGAQYYSQLSYLQTFVSDSLMVELDTVNEYMVVSYPPEGDVFATAPLLPDSLFATTARFRTAGQVLTREDERMLTLTSDYNPEVKSYTLTYDTATYRIRRATIAWWQAGAPAADTARVWLTHVDYRYQPFAAINMHERIRRIVSIRHGRVIPVERYSRYEVYSHL